MDIKKNEFVQTDERLQQKLTEAKKLQLEKEVALEQARAQAELQQRKNRVIPVTAVKIKGH